MYDLKGRPLSIEEWSAKYGFGHKKLRVRHSYYTIKGHRIWVATDCLGVDMSHSRVGPPIIFETMFFVWSKDKRLQPLPYPLNNATFRYATLEEALAGHKVSRRVVRKIRNWGVKPALIHKGGKP